MPMTGNQKKTALRKNVHFVNVPDQTPINLVDLDKSFDKS